MLERAYPEKRLRTPLAKERDAKYLARMTRVALLANRGDDVNATGFDLQQMLQATMPDYTVLVYARTNTPPQGWKARWSFIVEAQAITTGQKWTTTFVIRI